MKQIVAADTSLALSYFWSDRYKAPWYQRFYDFRQTDGRTPIAYIHSLGAAYRYRQLGLELAYGQAEGYMEQYMAKFAWDQDELSLSYQFYAARDRIQRNGLYQESDVYDGVAWRQAVTSVFNRYPLEYRLDISWVHAPGNQGFFPPPRRQLMPHRQDGWISDGIPAPILTLMVKPPYSRVFVMISPIWHYLAGVAVCHTPSAGGKTKPGSTISPDTAGG